MAGNACDSTGDLSEMSPLTTSSLECRIANPSCATLMARVQRLMEDFNQYSAHNSNPSTFRSTDLNESFTDVDFVFTYLIDDFAEVCRERASGNPGQLSNCRNYKRYLQRVRSEIDKKAGKDGQTLGLLRAAIQVLATETLNPFSTVDRNIEPHDVRMPGRSPDDYEDRFRVVKKIIGNANNPQATELGGIYALDAPGAARNLGTRSLETHSMFTFLPTYLPTSHQDANAFSYLPFRFINLQERVDRASPMSGMVGSDVYDGLHDLDRLSDAYLKQVNPNSIDDRLAAYRCACQVMHVVNRFPEGPQKDLANAFWYDIWHGRAQFFTNAESLKASVLSYVPGAATTTLFDQPEPRASQLESPMALAVMTQIKQHVSQLQGQCYSSVRAQEETEQRRAAIRELRRRPISEWMPSARPRPCDDDGPVTAVSRLGAGAAASAFAKDIARRVAALTETERNQLLGRVIDGMRSDPEKYVEFITAAERMGLPAGGGSLRGRGFSRGSAVGSGAAAAGETAAAAEGAAVSGFRAAASRVAGAVSAPATVAASILTANAFRSSSNDMDNLEFYMTPRGFAALTDAQLSGILQEKYPMAEYLERVYNQLPPERVVQPRQLPRNSSIRGR